MSKPHGPGLKATANGARESGKDLTQARAFHARATRAQAVVAARRDRAEKALASSQRSLLTKEGWEDREANQSANRKHHAKADRASGIAEANRKRVDRILHPRP